MSYESNFPDLFRRAADYVDKILRGAKPAEAEQPRNDMILRNINTGGVEVYDIRNNTITGAAPLGTVGLNWQFSGVGTFSSRGESDMLLCNTSIGGLAIYDIANNQLTGAVSYRHDRSRLAVLRRRQFQRSCR